MEFSCLLVLNQIKKPFLKLYKITTRCKRLNIYCAIMTLTFQDFVASQSINLIINHSSTT